MSSGVPFRVSAAYPNPSVPRLAKAELLGAGANGNKVARLPQEYIRPRWFTKIHVVFSEAIRNGSLARCRNHRFFGTEPQVLSGQRFQKPLLSTVPRVAQAVRSSTGGTGSGPASEACAFPI
jgi:hypothetical protein